MPELVDVARPRAMRVPRARAIVPAVGGEQAPAGPEGSVTRVPGVSTAHVLRLQRTAGNRAVVRSLQRAPAATAAHHAPSRTSDRNDTIDLLNSFEDLVNAAIVQDGRTLDTVRFGSDLGPDNRALLESIRAALIQAQASSPNARQAAASAWPALDRRLKAGIDHARRLRLNPDFLATVANNLAVVGELHVHARRKGPSLVQTPADYLDLYNGLNLLAWTVSQAQTDKTDAVVPTNIAKVNEAQRKDLGAIPFGKNLTEAHRALLEQVRAALILARTEGPGQPAAALSLWRTIQKELRFELGRMAKILVDPADRSTVHFQDDAATLSQKLLGLGPTLFVGGVYTEGHIKAVTETRLDAPDIAFQEERVKKAFEGFEEANKFRDKAFELASKDAIAVVLGGEDKDLKLAGAIFEVAKNPGDILKAIEEFRKKGLIGKGVTLAEIAEKTLALRNAVIKVSCTIVETYAKKEAEVAAAGGLRAAAARWGKVAKWAGEKLEALEKVEKIAGWITIAVSAIKVLDYVIQGKWKEAGEEIASTALGLGIAKISAGAGGAGMAMIAATLVIVVAEIDAIHGAAAMIEWCEDQNVHDSATAFINICESAALYEGQSLVADAKLLETATDPAERALIEAKLLAVTRLWLRDLDGLSQLIRDDRPSALGGQTAVREALGPAALAILQAPETWAGGWEVMAEQIRVIFAGANAMTRYVVKKYPRVKPEEKSED